MPDHEVRFRAGGLDVHSAHAGRQHRLELKGEFDLSAEAELETELRRVAKLSPAELVVDLSAVAFADSTAIRVLLKHYGGTNQPNGVSLIPPQPPADRAFRLTGADRALPFVR